MLSESLDGSHGRRIINLNRANTTAHPIAGNSRLTQVFDAEIAKHATFISSTQPGRQGGQRGLSASKDGNFLDTTEKKGFYSNQLNHTSANTLPNIQSREQLHESNAYVSEHTPQHIEGITEFLRAEYHRKFGCFINGARDEESKLVQFWRENISEDARKKRERLAELKRSQAA